MEGVTRNFRLLLRAREGVITFTNPVVAPAGTVAVRNVSDETVNAAAVPLKFTLVVPVRPCPRITIVLPTFPVQVTSPAKGLSPISKL